MNNDYNPLIDLQPKITKTGPEKMTSSTQAMEYTINFKSKVKGNAILRIVDKLPYKLDLEKSNIAEGVYDENALTITWEQAIAKVDDEIHDVNVTKQISLVYKDVDLTKDKITNTVTGKITLTEFKGEGEDEETFETENAVEGKVKIRYVEKETGKDLAEAKEIRGKVGTDYKTDGNYAVFYITCPPNGIKIPCRKRVYNEYNKHNKYK